MVIFSKLVSITLIANYALCPLVSLAWFFPVAQAASASILPTIQTVGTSDANTETATPIDMSTNLQTMQILSPEVAMASDRQPVDIDANIIIDQNDALSPEIGSRGTLADVTDFSDPGNNDSVSTYVVQSGDSIQTIATRFGISQNTIRWANGLKKGQVVHAGDTLIILPVSGVKYTIKKGDTLASIEKKFKLNTADEISSFEDYNGIDGSIALIMGDSLIIPGAQIDETPTTSSTSGKNTKHHGGITGAGNLFSYIPNLSGIVRDYFIKPIDCPLSQGRHDTYAVDISCGVIGTPIHAAADGIVEFAKYGWNGAYGNLIIMKHPNGMTTFYAHIKDGGLRVSQGETVKQGQVIAYVGSTGRSTGPHVHFEVRGGGNPGFDYSGNSWKPWSY